MASHESRVGMLSSIVVGLVVIVTGVVAGMVKVPPYFANRDVQRALDRVVLEVEPYNDDSVVLSAVNNHLVEVTASRFWVEDGKQRQDLRLQLAPEQVTITRDGNRSMDIDLTYTQQMWVPLLNKIDEQTFHAHAHAENKH